MTESAQQPFTLRPEHLPDDYPALAELLTATQPDWPTSAEHLRHRDESSDPAHFALRVLAEKPITEHAAGKETGRLLDGRLLDGRLLDGRLLGMGFVGHDDFAYEDWRYWSGLNVAHEARKQGVGSAIYAELERVLRQRGAREVRTMLSSKPQDAPGRAFLEHRGWKVGWERYESELDTARLDLHTFDPLLEQVAAQGIRVMSLAELESDPQRNRKLHELDWILFQDVPLGLTPTKKSQDQWVKEELDDPQLRPALSFVAVAEGVNDPLTGNYVGYSTIGKSQGEHYYIGMTGVRREYRGKGIAKALKVAAMRALQAQGGGTIKTFNDPPNKAMLSMNEALGFKRTATMYRYELNLGEE